MRFFDEIWDILNEGDVGLKFLKFELFYEKFISNLDICFDEISAPNELTTPCYAKFCDVVSMKELNKKVKPKDKNLNFIHSVAHIEFSAIDIALDACYRFRGLPREFYEDWLEVAEDEIRHFCMIENLLTKQGGRYGELSVHDGLFIALQKTSDKLTSRMALLPRYMEANGLDANAHIIKRLEAEGGQDELIECLKVILKEEVSHVYKGDKWFKFACKKEGVDEKSYFDIILNLYPNSFKSIREINEKDRLKAGFSEEELTSRELSPKGKEDAKFMASRLKMYDVMPEAIFSSSAKRSEQTAKIIAKTLKFKEKSIEIKDELYDISFEDLLGFVRNLDKNLDEIFIITHNPSIT